MIIEDPIKKKKKENYQVGRFKRKYYQKKRIIKLGKIAPLSKTTLWLTVRTQSFEDSNN